MSAIHLFMKLSVILICFSFLFVLTVSASPSQAGVVTAGDGYSLAELSIPPIDGPSDPTEVEAFLDLVMPAAIARYNAPGATVAVVKDGRLVVAKGYGYNDLANRIPIDADTVDRRDAARGRGEDRS
ncbi:MAG: D-aminopeptidase [Methanoregulaceae archaeon PtaU1.Bin222]|nr:MAG: D-aminopeptidase [Methanoregulaceae archaeon PtaU1.Bin222]